MLVALAGLPGTGKTALAARLAETLGGVVIGKDPVRAALFPPPALDHSRAQDDLTMAAVYAAAAHLLRTQPGRLVLLDGRTYSRRYQVDALFRAGRDAGAVPRVIECVCDEATARTRLDADAAAGTHPAGNRTFALYESVKATADPLEVPRLTLDTGRLALGECVRRAVLYLSEGAQGSSSAAPITVGS